MNRDMETYPKNLKIGPVAQKVLLLLLGGLALGLSRSPRQSFRILKAIRHDWKMIERRALHRAIKTLHHSKLIDTKENKDGSTAVTLTKAGREKAEVYQLEEMKIPPMPKWDKKWRVVLFDIPESRKKARDALTRMLKNLGFYQFQKSVFIHPLECQKEISFVIKFFYLQPYVRIILAEKVDNESHLKKHFGLL